MSAKEFTLWRVERGSQEKAAEELRLAKSTIQRYEAGTLPVPFLVRLATAYLTLVDTLKGALPQ